MNAEPGCAGRYTRKTRRPPRARDRFWALAFTLLGLALEPSPARGQTQVAARNPILSILLEEGVSLDGGDQLRLPPPTLPDGLDAPGQQAALASIADANHPLEQLLRKSVVAPFVLKLTSEGKSPQGVGRRMDLWFVAYGDFQAITAPGYFQDKYKEQADQPAAPNELPRKAGVLSDEELSARQLTVTKDEVTEEAYGYSLFSVFDKVQLSSTARVMQTRQAESVLFAAMLDPRFADDATYPNRWWPVEQTAAGNPHLLEPRPYAGSGAYGKLTKLHEPAGALFVEYHLVFNEPHDWFDGANLIGSKLPILVQDNVRKFRRDIAKAKAK